MPRSGSTSTTLRSARRRAEAPLAGVSRGAQAYESLRRDILTGVLQPGTRLREVEIAARLGLSRTPIREALGRLESDGMVVNEPSTGLIVTRLDPGMVGELYAMREVLEGTAARLTARHATDIEISMLRDIALRDRECKGDAHKLASNNRLLHQTLYRYAHNRYLLKTLHSLQESMALLGTTALSIPARQVESFTEHQAIIEALAARKADRAEELMRQHVRGAYKSHLALRLEQPQ